MAISASKPIPLKPAAGFLDLRSEAADITLGHRRVVLNKAVREQGREARAGGHIKAFGESEHGFLNQDFHDKTLDAIAEDCRFGDTATGCDESITFLYPAESSTGARKLIAGQNKRLNELAERSGVWRMIADGLGNPTQNTGADDCEPCGGHRIRGAQLLGYVVCTNNYNTPFAYGPGLTIEGCDSGTLGDLEALNVTRAGVVAQFKGHVFLADITMDGVAYPGLVMHSDFNAPLDFLPLPGTNLARSLTIGFSERVLAMEPLGDYLIAYTDKGIWRGVQNPQYVGETVAQMFSFQQLYVGPHALKYKHTVVNTGNEHVFAAVDGLYVLRSAFTPPERVEWIHRASGAIYSGLNKWSREFADLPEGVTLSYGALNTDACENFIGFYNPLTCEVIFSWPTDGNACANLSLRLNIRQGYEHASLIDEGYSAGCYFRPDDRPTYEEWLFENAGCPMSTPTQLTTTVTPAPYIWNVDENPLGEIAEDSLCAQLNNQTLEDICGGCEQAPKFIVASTTDNCLKELRDDVYSRESWDGTQFATAGYADFVQVTLGNLGTDLEKTFGGSEIPGLIAEFAADEQSTPTDLRVQVGFGISSACPTWRTVNTRKLKCLQSEADFRFCFRGRWLSFRMWSAGIFGGHSVSRVTANIKGSQTRG